MTQSTLDGHLRDVPPSERVIPYSDKAFREAAVEWLIATDQVCNLLYSPYVSDLAYLFEAYTSS